MQSEYVFHIIIDIISGSYQGGVPYLGSGTIILTVVAPRPPFWTVDSVDPSLSGVTQQTTLEYSARRVVGDCCSTMLKLSLTVKKKRKGESFAAWCMFSILHEK